MTLTDHIEHALGVVSLLVFAGAGLVAVGITGATIVPNLHRIRAALCSAPIPQAASATPHVACNPQRRGVEAAAAPAQHTATIRALNTSGETA